MDKPRLPSFALPWRPSLGVAAARLRLLRFALLVLLGSALLPAAFADSAEAPWIERVRALAEQATATLSQPGMRVQIEVGSLDPRLRLAPCAQVQPYLPPRTRLWGRARIGLRCASGPTAWNVYLPVTVKVFAQALAAAGGLPAGSTLSAADLRLAEVDIAAGSGVALTDEAQVLGRELARPLAAGQPLRSTDLKQRQWFASGDTVRLVAVGRGYSVAGEGLALAPGFEGRPVRVRTEGGRIVTGMAVGERRVEVVL